VSERATVYRLFAADNTLLYVGVAKCFGVRWEQHAKAQPWWPHVDHQTVHWFPDREDALLAEKVAIEAERPVYNIAGSPWRGGIKDDGTGFYVIPKPPRQPRVRTGSWGSPRHAFRFEPGLWASFLAAVARDPHGRNAAEIVRDLVAWYAHQRGAPKPERPARRSPG